MLDMATKRVITSDGEHFDADIIINTIPWNSILLDQASANELQDFINKLKHSSVEIRYFEKTKDSAAQWIYYPQEELTYHRCLLRNNFAMGSRGY